MTTSRPWKNYVDKDFRHYTLEGVENLNKFLDYIKQPEPHDVHYRAMQGRDYTKITILSRKEWGATPPDETKAKIAKIDKPVRVVTFSSTWTETCKSKEECSKVLKKLQEKHIKEGVHDILHNFMISDDGTVYEGRGWNKENFREPKDGRLEKNTFNIAYIGKYREPNNAPNELMMNAAFNLIKLGVEKGFIHKKFNVSDLNYM